MATAPNLVVAGDPGVARTLRETGRFPAVFEAASAVELRELSKSGQVRPPAAFMFAPGFTEDLPGAGVSVLANGLAGTGFTVLVHSAYTERGDVFDANVLVTARQVRLSELLATFGALDPEPNGNGANGNGQTGNAWPGWQPEAPTVPVAAAPKQLGKVIAIASAKGGVGKTSISVNLSVLAARLLHGAGRPGSVALIDTNFQQADVARYLNVETPTILDLIQSPGPLTAESARRALAHVPEIDLYALLGPPDAVAADPALVNSLLYRRILAVLREAFEYVFVDTPVAELYHTTFTDLILPEADAILVPVEPNRVTLEAARQWLRTIVTPRHSRGGGVAPEKLSLLLNRASPNVDCSPEEVMDLMPGWRFVGMIPEDLGWMKAVNNHQLTALHANAELEGTLRGILQAITGDPVFETAMIEKPETGWKAVGKKIFRLI